MLKVDQQQVNDLREGIIVPVDRRFVVYPGGAGVDEGDEECPGIGWPSSCDVLIEKIYNRQK